MSFIKAVLEHSPDGYIGDGQEMEVVTENIAAFYRDTDGTVVLKLNGGSVFRTSMSVQKVRDSFSKK